MRCLSELVCSRWMRKVLVRWSTSSARSLIVYISSAKRGDSRLKTNAPNAERDDRVDDEHAEVAQRRHPQVVHHVVDSGDEAAGRP